jgi:hypothetical protein
MSGAGLVAVIERRYVFRLAALGIVVTVATGALAQPRPSDADIFGGATTNDAPAEAVPTTQRPAEDNPANATQTPQPVATASPPAPVASPNQSPTEAKSGSVSAPAAATQKEAARDTQILGSTETPMFTEEAAPEDPLKVGGQLYLRMQSTGSQGQRFADFSFGSPSLVDLYLDARPNDRVRGFVLGRMLYDPTLPASTNSAYTISPVSASGSTSGSQSLSSLFQQQTRDPKVYLDQLWLKFDIAHRVFVTAGKQHVRWGTARFWAPTDYLHLRPRNPLDVFDARTGTTMVKLHLPIESRQWNFYAYGVTERQDSTPTLGRIAGAARAEFVVDTTEFGLGIFGQKNRKPKYAFDLSTGIGDFDFYGELALRYLDDIDRVRYDANAVAPAPFDANATPPNPAPSYWTPDQIRLAYLAETVDAFYPTYRHHGVVPQAVGGVNYSRKYNDNDMFTVGAEYFYNGLGYHSPVVYPGLVLPHTVSLSDSANFFYLGRHYAALYITFPAPYSLDTHTFTLSTIGNLSDQSFITRLDYSLVVLTHARFEAFVSGRYGNEEGEFRFGIRSLNVGSFQFSRPPAFMDLGVALRVAI